MSTQFASMWEKDAKLLGTCVFCWPFLKSKVPDEFGAISANSLHVDLLCTSHLCGEGLPWAVVSGWDHYVCLRTSIHDGEVWSSPWQIHGLLYDVPWKLGSRGCKCLQTLELGMIQIFSQIPHPRNLASMVLWWKGWRLTTYPAKM